MNQLEHEAKKIMDEFTKALEKIHDAGLDLGQKRKMQLRENIKEEKDEDFKSLMVKNTPHGQKDGYIVTEKKKW